MALEDLYNATVDILRPATTQDAYKGTVTLPMTTKATGVPCQITDPGGQITNDFDQLTVLSPHRVVFAIGVNVVKGDVLHDARTGTYYGVQFVNLRRPIGTLDGFLVAACVETQV